MEKQGKEVLSSCRGHLFLGTTDVATGRSPALSIEPTSPAYSSLHVKYRNTTELQMTACTGAESQIPCSESDTRHRSWRWIRGYTEGDEPGLAGIAGLLEYLSYLLFWPVTQSANPQAGPWLFVALSVLGVHVTWISYSQDDTSEGWGSPSYVKSLEMKNKEGWLHTEKGNTTQEPQLLCPSAFWTEAASSARQHAISLESFFFSLQKLREIHANTLNV